MMFDPAQLEKLLQAGRYETVRRLCLRELARNPNNNAIRKLLHQSFVQLGDFAAARQILDEIIPVDEDERLEVTLLYAADFFRTTQSGYYRDSEEAKAGFTQEECNEKMIGLAEEYFARAVDIARTEEQRRRISAALVTIGLEDRVEKFALPLVEKKAPRLQMPQATGIGTVSGAVKFADGQPAATVKLALGLQVEWHHADASREMVNGMGYKPDVGAPGSLDRDNGCQGCLPVRKSASGKAGIRRGAA